MLQTDLESPEVSLKVSEAFGEGSVAAAVLVESLDFSVRVGEGSLEDLALVDESAEAYFEGGLSLVVEGVDLLEFSFELEEEGGLVGLEKGAFAFDRAYAGGVDLWLGGGVEGLLGADGTLGSNSGSE